jgi:hypothetical protein
VLTSACALSSSCSAPAKLESTVKYPGIAVDDALAIAEQVDGLVR